MLRQAFLNSVRSPLATLPRCPHRQLPLSSLLFRSRAYNSRFVPLSRQLSSSQKHRTDAAAATTPADVPQNPPTPSKEITTYHGPLAATFRRLKIFSLSSLTLSTTLAPFMFLVESNLPLTARFALASIAIGTSGLSTALVGWCGQPYVTTLTRLKPEENDGVEGLEMTTLTLALHPRITRVTCIA